jgi:uncharacterized membrane protein
MVAAAVSALIGMAWGIQMSATGDHSLSPAHAHLNLLGWGSLAIFAVFYHLVPAAADSLLAKIQGGVAIVGLVLIVPGIVIALTQLGETLAKIGSVLTILSMLLFVVVILTKGRAAQA